MIVKERIVKMYEAEDGKVFATEHDCKLYEETLNEKKVEKLKESCESFRNKSWEMPPTTYYALSYTSDEHCYHWYKPTNQAEADTLKKYISLLGTGDVNKNNIEVGKYTCIETGYDKDVWIHENALTESINYIKEFMQAFEIDVETKLL